MMRPILYEKASDYFATDEGKIVHVDPSTGHPTELEIFELKPHLPPERRYYEVHLYPDNGGRSYRRLSLARLICAAFHGPQPVTPFAHLIPFIPVRHKDNDNRNNRPENLYWDVSAASEKAVYKHLMRKRERVLGDREMEAHMDRLLLEFHMIRASVHAQSF